MYKKVAFVWLSTYNYHMNIFERMFGEKPQEKKVKRPELETQAEGINPEQEIKVDLSQFPDLKKEAPKMSAERRSMAGFSTDIGSHIKKIGESNDSEEAQDQDTGPIMFGSQAQKLIDEKEKEAAKNREIII